VWCWVLSSPLPREAAVRGAVALSRRAALELAQPAAALTWPTNPRTSAAGAE
jgi:hypothetical protein